MCYSALTLLNLKCVPVVGLVLLSNVGPSVFLRHIYQLFQSCFNFNTASKAKGSYQFSGKITVKAKEKSYSKLEIPYQAEVLEG